MARKKAPTGPTPVDAITHGDKRANIPTADAEAFVDDEVEAVRKVRYQRDETLDPQLVWRGKYAAGPDSKGDDDLVVDAPPIYIQEKIDPRVLIENLRRTAERSEDEPEMTLFDDFDGLGELDLVDFYQHDANWSNRMILGDSLQVMSSLAERERLRGKVQMIYIDPPYGIEFGSNWQASARNRSMKDGNLQQLAREPEVVKAFRDTWQLGIHSYLAYLHDRLVVARDLLTETGSCFVQIGPVNAHYVASLMSEVFGPEHHVETIAFRKKTMPLGGRLLEGAYDYIVWFAKNKSAVKYRRLFRAQDVQGDSHWNVGIDFSTGDMFQLESTQIETHSLLPKNTDVGQLIGLYPVGPFETGIYDYEFEGRTYKLPPGKSWPSPRDGMDRLALAGRLRPYAKGTTLRYLLRHSDYPVTVYNNVWSDTSAATGMTYVVETSPKVIQRCMLMTTDPGDLVVDPTCGSGTTAFVAEKWGRRWITIDSSRVALTLARQRLMSTNYPWYLLADSEDGWKADNLTTGTSKPSFTGDIRFGFSYQKVPHITLRSIANNPDIKSGMDRLAIEEAIHRHAPSEVLYDRPNEDPHRLRVSGPFTIESLSPHRSLAFAGGPEASTHESASEGEAMQDIDGTRFEQSILDNLAKAGIQNGRRAERITFAAFETFAGSYIQALGERTDADEGESQGKVAIAIGPQYGTVSPRFVKDAAREALAAEGVDLLCILAFAFEPQVAGVTEDDGVTVDASDDGFANVAAERKLGRIPVLMVRMNADLLMGEELKKTGAGNLFTVFGEPDLEITDTADGLVVQLHGVDVYDPTTGEVRSKDTGQIALWMIDTDYNDDSFFVRHCYFTGGNDPYKRLKTALKADIDADAWASLYSTTSRPFTKPSTGKIAVKVINDYGDEVMKVFGV